MAGARAHHPLFVSLRQGGLYHIHGVTRNAIYYRVKRILDAAGIDKTQYSPHSLRHTFATRLHNMGINVVDIQTALRHRNVAVTMSYISQTSEILDSAASKVDFKLSS